MWQKCEDDDIPILTQSLKDNRPRCKECGQVLHPDDKERFYDSQWFITLAVLGIGLLGSVLN